jgi:hypothetical protein
MMIGSRPLACMELSTAERCPEAFSWIMAK